MNDVASGHGHGSSRTAKALRTVMSALPSPVPRRQEQLRGQYAVVDGISYSMPVNSDRSPVLMGAFPMELGGAAAR